MLGDDVLDALPIDGEIDREMETAIAEPLDVFFDRRARPRSDPLAKRLESMAECLDGILRRE